MQRELSAAEIAARCHEIQVGLGTTQVAEFDALALVGMATRLALHLRGLPAIDFDIVRLVGNHYLDIPSVAIRQVVFLLAEIEFVKLGTEGKTIKTVLPNVPYYENVYTGLGDYAKGVGFNEAEQLSIDLLHRLARSPEKLDRLRTSLGADNSLLNRAIAIGQQGAYLKHYRARGQDVLLTPTHFSENPDIYADIAASGQVPEIAKLMTALKAAQGFPLSIIEATGKIGNVEVSPEQVRLVTRLAQEGVVKPPSITTDHAGDNYFLFTPTPSEAGLSPTKRDIYEKAMAIVAAVRQGQYLPKAFAIREPGAVLYTLRRDLRLQKATTEAAAQYKNLVHLRVAALDNVGGGYRQLRIIETEENKEALDIAYDLVDAGAAKGIEVDPDARKALQQDQSYIDSLVASGTLKKANKMPPSPEQLQQLEFLFLK